MRRILLLILVTLLPQCSNLQTQKTPLPESAFLFPPGKYKTEIKIRHQTKERDFKAYLSLKQPDSELTAIGSFSTPLFRVIRQGTPATTETQMFYAGLKPWEEKLKVWYDSFRQIFEMTKQGSKNPEVKTVRLNPQGLPQELTIQTAGSHTTQINITQYADNLLPLKINGKTNDLSVDIDVVDYKAPSP